MNKSKPYLFKRVIAYFVDMFIIAIVSSILINFAVNDENYIVNSNKLMDLMEQTMNGEVTQEEYTEQYNQLNYEITKSTVDITIIMSAVSLVYYVIFCYCRDGRTLGKQLMGIKIVSKNGKKLHINNYLIRTLLINQVLLDIVSSAMIILLNRNAYNLWFDRFSTVYSCFLMASLIFAAYRNDGRGLHDIIANTKVVNVKKGQEELVENEIKEAEYEELPNTIQVDSKDIEEEHEKEEKKKSKKKNKKINESPEGVSESERI